MTPSPYVSIYVPRSQAHLIAKLLAREAHHKAESNPSWQALRNVRKAIEENA